MLGRGTHIATAAARPHPLPTPPLLDGEIQDAETEYTTVVELVMRVLLGGEPSGYYGTGGTGAAAAPPSVSGGSGNATMAEIPEGGLVAHHSPITDRQGGGSLQITLSSDH